MPRVTPSYTSVEVTVSKPSGLCEGLGSSQITYEFKVYRSNSLVTTENVTTSGPTTTATLSGLSGATEYKVEIHACKGLLCDQPEYASIWDLPYTIFWYFAYLVQHKIILAGIHSGSKIV